MFRINGRSATVIGVAEPAPSFPTENDVFVNMVTSPHHLDATMVTGRTHRMTEVFARLAPGATVEQARAEITALTARLRREHPDAYDPGAGFQVTVAQLRDALTEKARRTVLLLTATAALVLLTACANVANLVLTRGVRRERELAIRWALGAEPGTAPPVAADGNRDPRRPWHRPRAGPRLSAASTCWSAFAERFTPRASEIRWMVACSVFAVVAATASALAVRLRALLRGPEESGAVLTRAGSRRPARASGSSARLVVAQVAVYRRGAYRRGAARAHAAPALCGGPRRPAGEHADDGGADPFEGDRTPAQGLTLHEEMQRRLAALPGVSRGRRRVERSPPRLRLQLELKAEARRRTPGSRSRWRSIRTATPEYFPRGRHPAAPGPWVRRHRRTAEAGKGRASLNAPSPSSSFPARIRSAGGSRGPATCLRFIPLSPDWRTIVGVVGDTRDAGPDAPPMPAVYQPMTQNDFGMFPGAIVIRARGAAGLGPQAGADHPRADPDQPVERVATLGADPRGDASPRQRLNAILVGAFGAVALAIAAVGIGGVLAFFIARRTAEIGIRMSLGADPMRVMGMVLGDGARLLALGLGLGLLASALAARLIQGMLFGVPPQDPVTFLSVAALVSLVGLGACALPALRAARVDPMVAIRAE